MADQDQSISASAKNSGMFAEPPQEKRFPTTAVAIASAAVVILTVFLLLMGHRKGGADTDASVPQAAASYASNLAISDLQLSEAESISGGKVTYVDGHIANHGSGTVTAITAQVSFPNDAGTTPQMIIVPLNLIRMRQPYVDTEPISDAPLTPNREADFRLIFEGVDPGWNNQPPAIRLIRVTTK